MKLVSISSETENKELHKYARGTRKLPINVVRRIIRPLATEWCTFSTYAVMILEQSIGLDGFP